MSDERFDKLIKTNLEAIRPAYDPGAWDRLQKRLPVAGFWSLLVPYGGWLLSGLMLAGWLTTFFALHENQQLIDRLARPSPAQPLPPAVGPIPAHRVDTVYIVQRTIVEHRYYTGPVAPVAGRQPYPNDPAILTDSMTIRQPGGIDPLLTDVTVRNVQRRQKAGYNPPSGRAVTVRRTETDQVRLAAPTTAVAHPSARSRLNPMPPTPTAPHPPAKTLEQQTTKPPTGIGAADSSQRAIANTMVNGRPDSSARSPVRPDAAGPLVVTVPVAISSVAAGPSSRSRPAFRLSSLQPRVGIGMPVTPGSIGVGPLLEVFPIENLGLSAGVQTVQIQTEEYPTPRSFNAATGRDFLEQYRTYLPATYDQIQDISIRTSLISLPLNLRYYIPLRRQWSVFIQAGTRFDLAAYQQLRFESYLRQEDQTHIVEVKAEPVLFHNFSFGAGVQYHRSWFSAQLSPYYIYDFRNLANTSGGSNVGINASVWLDLFR